MRPGRRRWVVAFLIAAVVGAAIYVARRQDVMDLRLGAAGRVPSGQVRVDAWRPPGGPAPGQTPAPSKTGPRSEIDVVSCRTSAEVPLLRAGLFRLQLPDGSRLEPSGSRLRVARAQGNCIGATILFATGTKPAYALYDAGSTTLRWPVP